MSSAVRARVLLGLEILLFPQSWFHHNKKSVDKLELKERRAKDLEIYSSYEKWTMFLGYFTQKSQRNNMMALLQCEELYCIKRIWLILCSWKGPIMIGIGINTRIIHNNYNWPNRYYLIVNFLYRDHFKSWMLLMGGEGRRVEHIITIYIFRALAHFLDTNLIGGGKKSLIQIW